jgi:hypothetical protein
MESVELVVDGRFFEHTVEDVDHLIWVGHDTVLWSGAPALVWGRGGCM